MKNIVFDVGGTLWDTTEFVAKAWNRAIRVIGGTAAIITPHILKKEFGKPMDVIADNLFYDVNEIERELLLQRCFKYEHDDLSEDTDNNLYPGIKENRGRNPL